MTSRKWSSSEISWALYHHAFRGKHIVCAQNTYWPGSECDILIVRNDLRLMEVEIKVSRSDLKADKHKDKWKKYAGTWAYGQPEPTPVQLTHPTKIWKHYYALPRDIWKPELIEDINPCSGIILIGMHTDYYDRECGVWATIERQAKPNKEAKAISAYEAIDIARIQNMKYWQMIDETRRSANFTATRDTASSAAENNPQTPCSQGS